MKRFLSLAALGVVAFAPLAPAQAQTSPVFQRVQWGGGGGGGDQQAAENSLRMNRIEEQLRQMNGRNEELIFRIQRLEDQLKRLQEDTNFRLQDLEGAGSGGGNRAAPPPQRRGEVTPPAGSSQQANARSGGGNSAANPSTAAPGPQNLGDLVGQSSGGIMDDGRSGAPVQLAPQGNGGGNQVAAIQGASAADDYAMGIGFLQRREYDYAEAQFTQFLQQYPQDANIPNALYGLGESYFYRKRYNDALENYLKVVQEHGSSQKAPESLLRLGVTLAAMNEKQQGCAALAEVARKYPNANAAKSMATRESKRLAC